MDLEYTDHTNWINIEKRKKEIFVIKMIDGIIAYIHVVMETEANRRIGLYASRLSCINYNN